MLNILIQVFVSFLSLGIGIVCLYGNFRVGLSIILSLGSGLALSYYSMQVYHPIAMIMCALICLTSIDSTGIKNIRSNGNEVTHAIVYLYCLRVLLEISMVGAPLYLEAFWVGSTVMLLLQLTFAAGSCSGHADRINSAIRGGLRFAYRRVS